ncbi:MAG TPA: hypothetical protein VGF03_18850 [Bryobacteraceae bacterium]
MIQGKRLCSPWTLLSSLLLAAALAQAAPPSCGTQFQYSCSAATLGGYTVITPLASTGQTEITGYNTSNTVVFDVTIPIPPSGASASDSPTQNAVLQADTLLAASLGPACNGTVQADCTAPNPGGKTVVTNSTSSTYVAQDTPVSQQVNRYSTTLKAILNGSQNVYQQTFAVAFTDPAVQAAVTAADAILTGDNATFGAPAQTSTSTVLQSSQLSYVLTGDTAATGNITTTTTDTFGPAAILVGDNQTEVFIVLSGQLDINVNTNIEYYAARNDVTTNTYLTTQSYTISGSATAPATPAPASWLLLVIGLGVAGLLTWLRRLRNPEA